MDYKELKKNGFMQQKQKDCFSMRLKNVGGHFTAAQLQTVAKVAEKFGAGYVHLTSRQGIEIPFIKAQDIEDVKKALAEGGVSVGVCGPRVRTITACQGSAVCSSGLIDTARLANEFDKRYGGRELPHKFKFGFTGCRNNCLKAEENDIGIRGAMVPSWSGENCIYCGACERACKFGAIQVDRESKQVNYDKEKCVHCGRCVKSCPTKDWKGRTGFSVSFGGRYGNQIAVGRHVLSIIFDETELYAVVDAALDFFSRNAQPGERFRCTLDRTGWDGFQRDMEEAARMKKNG